MLDDILDVLIVDDESIARQRIKRFLKEAGYECEVREAVNGLEALTRNRERPPQLLFLDIEMPGMTGLELLQQIPERSFPVIFQTAYDEFAINAFEENACDYLLKPFSQERFLKSFDRGLSRRSSGQRELEALTDRLANEQKYPERLAVKAGRDLILIETKRIDYVTSEDHVTCVFSESREHISELSLDRLERILDPQIFMRIHRGTIVPLTSIVKISRGTETTIELTCGKTFGVSRRNVTSLLEKLHR